MTSSKLFLYFCLFFISGIFLASIINIYQPYLVGVLIFGVVLIFSLFFTFKEKKLFLAGFFLLFLVLGISRYQMAEFKIENNELKQVNDSGEKITLIGKVSAEPDIRENQIKLEIEPNSMEGKILAVVSKYSKYEYGDTLEIKGKLKTPQEFEDFNYKDYLAKDGIFSVVYYPEIKVLEKNKGNFFYSKVLQFKNKLREVVYNVLSPPKSSILGAMILGDKNRMSQDLKEKLNIVGLRHITAVSGMHVVILTSILMSFLLGIGFWRGQAFYLTIIIICLFVLMTGAQSSAVRAGIVGGLFLLGQKIGRESVSFRSIVFAAFLMLLFNPLLLRYDVGFQLSFLAVLGILYLSPFFKKILKFLPEENFFNLRSILTMTFSAQIFTLPVLIYNFGRVSIIAPLINVLILPFVSWVMILGFSFAFVGMIYFPLGWLLSFFCWFLLSYIIKVIDVFSSFSFSTLSFKISWFWLIFSYFVLIVFVFFFQKKKKLFFEH